MWCCDGCQKTRHMFGSFSGQSSKTVDVYPHINTLRRDGISGAWFRVPSCVAERPQRNDKGVRHMGNNIRVTAIRREEPDIHLYVLALIALARQLQDEDAVVIPQQKTVREEADHG